MANAARRTRAKPALQTLADLLDLLGHVPLDRIRARPPLGTATEKDVLAALEGPNKRLCELVSGVLVEKPMGAKESHIAGILIGLLNLFLDENDLGATFGEAGAMRFMPGLVRIPDVSFVSWNRLGGEMPRAPIPDLVPDLAVEVISKSNTPEEMKRKLQEYFAAGVLLVWFIYPRTQTAEVFTSPVQSKKIGKNGTLDGGNVLPGFSLPLKKLFSRVNRRQRPS
jgi:Uma2 family endonuclease